MKLAFLFVLNTFFLFQNWQEFTSPEGRFKILTPGRLTEKTDSVTTAVGQLAYHTFFYQPKDKEEENLFYMVSYCDYPEGILFADSTGLADEFFKTTMETAAKSVKGEILYFTDIELGKYPGKAWRIDYLDGKAVIKTKAYLAVNRYYAVQIVSYQEKNINPSSDKFFESFRIF